MVSAENCCEHGDHPAPAGKRFCSVACERCESAPPDYGVRDSGCSGLCDCVPRARDAIDAEIAVIRGWRYKAKSCQHWREPGNDERDAMLALVHADHWRWCDNCDELSLTIPPPFSCSWALAGPLMGEFGDVRLFSPAPDLSTWLCVWHEVGERREEIGASGPEAIARAWLAWKRAPVST